MIKILKPYLKDNGNTCRLEAEFVRKGIREHIWFEVQKEYSEYLVFERVDPFITALLLYAMKNGEDIYVDEPMSEKLYYGLTNNLIKVLSKVFGFKPIKIYCSKLESQPISNTGSVGTGLSCGIDSFSTISEHLSENCPQDMRITHFTFFNVGSHRDYGGVEGRTLFKERFLKVEPLAKEMGIPLIFVDSNISEILQLDFQQTHTIRSMAAVMALQKLFKIYYYSSSYPLENFQLKKKDSAYYDIFNLNMLSTETTTLYSTGALYNRVEKTKIVAGFEPAQRFLNVCVIEDSNCGVCFKCLRTLITLDILGEIEHFNKVFDLNNYFNHREKHLARILADRKYDLFLQEIYDEIVKQEYKLTLFSRVWSVLIRLKRIVLSK